MGEKTKTRIITGNEAVALGALRAGVKVVTGYPGTPSTGALAALLEMDIPHGSVHVEWSTNEKVALDVVSAASWAGQRTLCTMKMSGLNVAYDSLISLVYSGCTGGMVIYVADDPGTTAGMVEQDSRGFAIMSDVPILEPESVADTYRLTRFAFDLSEEIGSPVFVRLVTATANSMAAVEVEEPLLRELPRQPVLIRDVDKYTKAGPSICMAQHRDLINRLEKAGQIVREHKINRFHLAQEPGGLGVIAAGVVASYLEEGFEIASGFGFDPGSASVLRVVTTSPFPTTEVQEMLRHCSSVLVLEELEPHIEKGVYVEAQKVSFRGKITGKLDGTFSRIGEYTVSQVVQGLGVALGLPIPQDLLKGNAEADRLAADRPLTFCAGCPHRGTYMAINKALKKLKYKKDEVMVAGDIGCTILGMNPPLSTVWNEISMGASIGMAQGYVHSGIQTPVIAAIGDSTFFHGGIPALINAVQHRVPITVVILDNGWTAMTGMQVNPGTAEGMQFGGDRRIDVASLIEALGVEHFFAIDPFEQEEAAATIQKALTLPGVKVVHSRRECAMPALRRGERIGKVRVIAENCNLCKLCISTTGCPAISIEEKTIAIDAASCLGCGLCAYVCNRGAIEKLEECAA